MRSIGYWLSGCALGAVLGCSAPHSRAQWAEVPAAPPGPPERTQSTPPPHAATTVVEADVFEVPMPVGYHDAIAQVPEERIVLVFAAKAPSRGYLPTITIQRVSLPGGSFDDPVTCAQTGRGLVEGGILSPGTGGVLKSARIIDGPLGKTCQVHLVESIGVAIITELHRPGNTPMTPQDIWLMTCNHADGDDLAEAVCRSTLSGVRFRDP